MTALRARSPDETFDAVTFRRATVADVAAIVRLMADDDLSAGREIVGESVDPAYLSAFAAIDADLNQLLVVGERDGRIVATLQLTFTPYLSFRGAWRGTIENVRVARDVRDQRIGAALIGWAEAQCRAHGCRTVQLTSLTSRDRAHRFYERLGYAASHVGFKKAL